MHRRNFLQMLDRYLLVWPEENNMVMAIKSLVEKHEDCFLRTCGPGHITGSAWITSGDGKAILLTHHGKLDRWLQLGGHADGNPDVEHVALREAREESGMNRFEFSGAADGETILVPLDVDVHVIPARGSEPEHEHHDIRFWLIAAPGQELAISNESKDIRWFSGPELLKVTQEESVLRMMRKVAHLLER